MMGKKKIELTCLMRASGECGNICEELLIATNFFVYSSFSCSF